MVLNAISSIESSPLQYTDVAAPEPMPKEIRVKVRCCAVCRTDLHVIEGDLPAPKLPLIPGHQIVGQVDGVGSLCKHLQPGMRVGIAWLRHTCGTCVFCSAGRENLCPDSLYTGYHADGGFAEYALVPEDFAYEIPDVVSDVDAAPLLCAGIIGYRALQRTGLPSRGRLALFGFGSSAHIVLQIAAHRGHEVYVVSRSAHHQKLARELGAVWAGSDPAQMPAKVNAAILFAPVGSLVRLALVSLDRGGTLALAGIHMTDIPALNYQTHLFWERDIHPVTANTRQDARQLLHEAAQIPVHPHTRCYPLRDANRALLDMKQGHLDGTGVLTM